MSFISEENPNPYFSDPDVQLMLEFQKGDPASFEKLMSKYYKRILNFNYRFLGSKQTAEDLTQEVFIRVYRNAHSYRPQSKFQTWLYTIAHHAALNEARKLKRKIVSLEETFEADDSQLKRQIEDHHTPSPTAEILSKERQKVVKEAIDSLPENQKVAVILRRYEDLSYEEIAETMKCSVEAVKSLLNRAKENLKIALHKYIKE